MKDFIKTLLLSFMLLGSSAVVAKLVCPEAWWVITNTWNTAIERWFWFF